MNNSRILLENPHDASPCGDAIPKTNEERVKIVQDLTAEINEGVLNATESIHSRLRP